MRVAADELRDEGCRDVVDVEGGVRGGARVGRRVRALGRDAGVEEHLEQEVAELLLDVLVTVRAVGQPRDRLGDLSRLLEGVRGERLVRLLRVPRAATGAAQPVHHRDRVEQPSAGHVPRADEHLDLRGFRERGELTGQGVAQAGVAVRGPQPDDLLSSGTRDLDEPSGQVGRVHPFAHRLDVEARRPHGCDESLVVGAGQTRRCPLETAPRIGAEQPRGDPGAAREEDDPTVHASPQWSWPSSGACPSSRPASEADFSASQLGWASTIPCCGSKVP